MCHSHGEFDFFLFDNYFLFFIRFRHFFVFDQFFRVFSIFSIFAHVHWHILVLCHNIPFICKHINYLFGLITFYETSEWVHILIVFFKFTEGGPSNYFVIGIYVLPTRSVVIFVICSSSGYVFFPPPPPRPRFLKSCLTTPLIPYILYRPYRLYRWSYRRIGALPIGDKSAPSMMQVTRGLANRQ